MQIRSDIQILRGVSVLLVVLFHMGFKNVQSGFLGVDIFFVISGFLMAVLYKKDSKIAFFMRRAKRLLPAYFAVVIFTLITSFLLNTPNESAQVVSQSRFASIFSSNVGFWMQNSYFSKAEFNPLLHLWSLGVEVQFYLLVPLLAWFFSKHKIFLPFAIIVSATLCFILVGISSKTAFFITPFRVWEFLIGYAAASYFTNKGDLLSKKYVWIGFLFLIVLSLIPFMGISGDAASFINGHPGLFALLVSLATALVLMLGLPERLEVSFIGRFLAKLGDYSYSIYLAHFPIIVLYLSKPFMGTVVEIESIKDYVIIFILIVIFSVALHHLVERRFKTLSFFKLVVLPVSFILFLSVLLPYLQFKTMSIQEQYIFNAFSDRSTYRCGKVARIIDPKAITCRLTASNDGAENEKRIMLVGNSHADSIKTSFVISANKHKSTVFFMVANNPLMNGGLNGQQIIDEALNRDVSTIVLHFSPGVIKPEVVISLVEQSEKVGLNIVYIDSVPIWDRHIPMAMYNKISQGVPLPKQSRSSYIDENKYFVDALSEIESPDFKRYSVVDYLCNTDCLFMTDEGEPLYFDSGHLTLTGSSLLNTLFDKIIVEAR